MTTFLLAVNVLRSLLDTAHVHHDAAHEWFGAHGHKAWATCPLTENGVLRIVGHPRYPNSAGTPSPVMALMATLRTLPGHVFWPDELSPMEPERIDASRLLTSAQVTDSYLLVLVCAHDGHLATLDLRLVTDAGRGGKQRLHVIR